ncbi:hypothetical protein C8R43DRAFT_996328 [Mycena crocata]|nr:hypothetical protein C8R43DRAFT_996328 [Mycena crocata]
MPILPKVFRRQRTTGDLKSRASEPPGSSNLTQPALYEPTPTPDLRRGMSVPLLAIPGSHLSSASLMHLPIGFESKMLPPTPGPETSPVVPDGMTVMWRGLENRDANISRSEKMLNKISDTAAGAVNGVGASDGVVGIFKSVAANEDVQAIGKTILEGVPAIMSALEALTDIHPFLKAAYLPFKLIYHQETQRRENDQKRTTLFEKIKDVMLVLLELKDVKKDDTRTTPEGQPMLSRLALVCKEMNKDIEECYNVLNTQEKRSVGIKFLKASSWNKVLGEYALRFTTTRERLVFALNLKSAVTMDEMNSNMKKMMDMFMTMMSPQERDMGRWIDENGGEKVVLGSDSKCAAMIQYEATLTTVRGGRFEKAKTSDDGRKKNEARAIAALRQEYRQDIQTVIQENLESFSKRFQLGLDDLGKDLSNKIQHQGDRLIKYLKGGPHGRLKDKMIYHVWREQGWKGSAKTRPLVLSIRDYFVERVEHSKLASAPKDSLQKRPVSTVPGQEDDNDDDPEADISVPLPDSWMIAYLQVKRLRYLQQAFDADCSGFVTISEINSFTQGRPLDWSLPQWISYWAIGWQISATKYCVEIEELFSQMFLLRKQIGIQMPGNKRYVNDYLNMTWDYVTALTSSIERYDSPPQWLEQKFTDYVESQEKILKERLEKIDYDIESLETITTLVLHGTRIEQSVFVLIALLMRRDVAKMHVCLKREIASWELEDAGDTVQWVVDAAYARFIELKESFLHQEVDVKQTFEFYSCGLFKNYYNWGDSTNMKYFMDSDMAAWSSVNTIRLLDQSELDHLMETSDSESEESESDVASIASSSPVSTKSHTVEESSADSDSQPGSPVKLATTIPTETKPSSAEMDITGTWHGWHWTDTRKPCLPMSRLKIKCGKQNPESESETAFSGNGSWIEREWVLNGTMNSAGQPQATLAVNFERTYDDDGSVFRYNGTFSTSHSILTGTFTSSISEGFFFFKKVPESNVLCSRPLTLQLSPKELWSFACDAVIRRLGRQKPSLSYITNRMAKIRRAVQFMHRTEYRNATLGDAEIIEWAELQKSFSFEEISELYKLYFWYQRAGDLQPQDYSCDGCDETIKRSRVLCLNCTSGSGGSIDLCSKPSCIASATLPQRTDVTHLSSHLMVKTRDLLLLRDHFMLKQRAEQSLNDARALYSNSKDNSNLLSIKIASETSSPRAFNCVICNESVVTPCWYCLDCKDSWVCDSCESKIDEMEPWDKEYRAKPDPEAHNIFHILVRVARETPTYAEDPSHAESLSPRDQWENVERRVVALMNERFSAINTHVDGRFEAVEARLTQVTAGIANIERLLNKIAGP